MTDREQVIKHLEIIQGVINRLAHDSFLIKGWSMTILAATVLFIARNNSYSEFIMLVFIIPVIGFWVLDGYFLWQEKLFIGIYNDTRKQKKTDFLMNISDQLNKPKNKWRNSIFSLTLKIFYLIQIFFVISVFIILKFY